MSKKPKANFKKTTKYILIQLSYFVVLFLFSYQDSNAQKKIKVSEKLQITKINERSYIHISYLNLKNGASFSCNGFIYINNNEAYVFDTPANDEASSDLINWLQKDIKVKIKGVIFNHFHKDCLEGMDVFKKNNIPCIASKKTANYMQLGQYDLPDQVFENNLDLTLGNKNIYNAYFGEAHTKDNIVSYFPEEQLIYGGCMIKSLKASKGNLSDANVAEWSKTVTMIKEAYPKIEIVIPGHGDFGNSDLLDYTISLFKIED